MSLYDEEKHSLNAPEPKPKPRGFAIQVFAVILCVFIFASLNLPTFVFFADFSGDASNKIVNGSHSSERYAIAVGQTLTSSAVFLHAPLLVAMGPSDAPLTVGLLWYIVICLLLTVMYQITGVAAVAMRFTGDAFEVAELSLLGCSLLLTVVLLVLAALARQKHVGQRFQKNFCRVNALSWVLMGITGALTGAGLALDFRNGGFHFSQLVFLNSFFFRAEPSGFSITASVLYVAALATVPYSQTVFRLSFDKFISRAESVLNVLVLFIIILSQIVVFVCSVVYLATNPHVEDMDASVVVLLLVTGIFVLRGVSYLLYVGVVVSKEVTGQRKGPQLLSR